MKKWAWLLVMPWAVVLTQEGHYEVRLTSMAVTDEAVAPYETERVALDMAEALNQAHRRRMAKPETTGQFGGPHTITTECRSDNPACASPFK